MKKTLTILTALASLTIANTNAGIQIPVQPLGHDANGYPVFSTPGLSGGDVYDSDGRYLGRETGLTFGSFLNSKPHGWLVRSPNGQIIKIYANW